jgi:allantoinase
MNSLSRIAGTIAPGSGRRHRASRSTTLPNHHGARAATGTTARRAGEVAAAMLKELGVSYVCDWVLDDLPAPLATAYGLLVALPYTLELNDSVVFAVEHHTTEEFERRVRATLDAFAAELAENPRVLTLALHPHLIGVPHRIGALARSLDALLARDDSVFLTGSEIADWYTRHSPEAFWEGKPTV